MSMVLFAGDWGGLTWMNAVAIMTPEPKYFAAKKHFANILLLSAAPLVIIGKKAPE
jgi:hypothetical protein